MARRRKVARGRFFILVAAIGVGAMATFGIRHRLAQPGHPATSASPAAPSASVPLAWMPAPFRLPYPVAGAAGAVSSQAIWLAGGFDTAGTHRSVLAITPRGATVFARLPYPVHDAAAAVAANHLWVLGGGVLQSQNLIQWVDLRNGTSRAVAGLPLPLSDLSAAYWNHHLYAIGGHDAEPPLPFVWRLALPARSHPVGPPFAVLPQGLRYAAVAEEDKTVWIAGGVTPHGLSATVLTVDLQTGAVHRKPSLPVPTAYAAAAVWNGQLMVIGGKTPRGWTAATWRWNAHRKIWESGPPLPAPAGDGLALIFDQQLFWLGGMVQGRPASVVWILRPSTSVKGQTREGKAQATKKAAR